MNIITALKDFHELSNNVTDKRVANWLFVSSPFPTLSIVGIYLFVACFAGPKLMEKRKAVNCSLFLPLYNFALVLLNYYILQEVISGSYNANYSYMCTPLRKNSMDKNEMKVTNAIWWYYISKHVELLDTMFFILRKHNRLVTVLHVYHHATMPCLWWLGVKWVPGGQSFFIVLINSGIHVVMYIYYGLAALGPKMRKYLWWKKYLTIMQLVQFFCVLIHTSTSLFVECPDYPVWMHWLVLAHCSSILALFANFYYHAYLSAGAKNKTDASTEFKKKNSFLKKNL